MVEVQFVRSTTHHALSTVSPPYFHLHVRRNNTTSNRIKPDGRAEVLLPFYCEQLELKDFSAVALLAPGVDKVEDSVVGPNTLPNLLIYADSLWKSVLPLRLLSGEMEQPILCQIPQ